MNVIKTHPVDELGYNFINEKYIPEGYDEYYLRNFQNKDNLSYKPLSNEQIERLNQNGNTSDNWNNILGKDGFNADLVKNCKFYGLVRIGSLSPAFKEFHDFRMPVGIYNSTIISCDFGDDVCIDNVQYLSHYIIESEVMIANVNELACTNHSKFGTGVIKEDESEAVRTKIEVCNENGGRWILPFNTMLPGDAFLWSRYRDDEALMNKFKEFTDKVLDKKRGYYGLVGTRSVIKNCKIIKDTWIGTDAYIKGANKIKNITINSDDVRHTQIGEGVELVNGIIGFGCRIFYGVKAVRFVLSSYSQLKYGARLINSFLGNNSTISCCEVLNSLIFPTHEQHHNNSFLCAALVMGQSNLAAGATIGSNHNSRGADGEIIAGRGFWPGLCVSLKHNTILPSFTIMAKGDYPSEMKMPIPFSLISNDVANNELVVMPAYWFMYNMYAMERNAWKSHDRDKRTNKTQRIEYNYLAPDTINEIFTAIAILERVETDENGTGYITGWENSDRKTKLLKVNRAIEIFKVLIEFYTAAQLLAHIQENGIQNFEQLKNSLSSQVARDNYINVGGQLIKAQSVARLKKEVKGGTINNWDELHDFYVEEGKKYDADKLQHAYTSFLELKGITGKQFTETVFNELLGTALETKDWMVNGIFKSREKDYTNPFRKMVYETNEEMNKVLGKLEDNNFIQMQMKELSDLKETVERIKSTFSGN